MQFIYRMSRKMFFETLADAEDANMRIEKYITAHFGIRGECVKVEIMNS